MPYLIVNTSLAIPMSKDLPDDASLADINKTLPKALQAYTPDILAAIQKLKSYAVKVNEGAINEEMTVTAQYHIHRHDIRKECSPDRGI